VRFPSGLNWTAGVGGPLMMLWTAPPRHESAIEMGAVRTSHDSEEPGHAHNYDRWSRYREVSVSGSWHRCGWQCCCSPSAQAALCSDVLFQPGAVHTWPIATDDALTASRRFRGIADIDRFSSRNDL